MAARSIGDVIAQLPTDPHQDFTQQELHLFNTMSTKKFAQPPKLRDHVLDSDTESDIDSDAESDTYEKKPSMWSEIKSTFLASLLFVLLSSDVIDTSIQKIGIDGMKLTLVKIFLFATFYFILRYKFT